MNQIALIICSDPVFIVYALVTLGWCLFCALFTAFVPVKWTEKLPDWVMVIINISAVNVKNAVNRVTDIKGNPK